MVDVIHFDFETRSEQDLRKIDAFRYAEDDSTEALCMAYKLNEGKELLWKMGEPQPPVLKKKLGEGALFVAHNIQFDANIWEHTCGWGHIPVSQRRDTAAYAAALALPRNLDGVGDALGLPIQKSKEGHKLMMKMCKPRRPSKANPAKYWELPEQLENLYEYCIRDVETESLLANAIRPLIDIEQKIWEVSERINARGVRIDVRAVEIILDLLEQASENAKDTLPKYGLPRDAINKRDKVLQWVSDQGYEMPGYTKADVKRALADPDCPDNVKAVLSIRQRIGKSSTAKYKKIMDQVCKDHRIRGTMLYHGASTGRWAGRGLQPQNMPRGSVKDTDEALTDIMEGDLGWVEMMHGDFFEVASSCIRGVLTASPGNRLIVCDYSAIEARVLAWVARQEDIIEVFRGHGKIYEHTASGIYNVPVDDISKEQRFVGKVASLALGYGGGVKAFVGMADMYGVKISEEKAEKIKTAYREANSNTVKFWYDVEKTAKRAIRKPGAVITLDRLKFQCKDGFLKIRLPIGRNLYYYKPKIENKEAPWGMTEQITFMGMNSMTHKWMRLSTYSGKLVENIVQAIARDLLAEAMIRCEDAGYPIVLSIHDELIADVPKGEGSLEEFAKIMVELPDWAEDMPVKGAGFESFRYKKD